MARPRDRAVWKEGNYSRWRDGDRFIKKLFAIAHRRVLPVPVSPDDCGERASAFRHHEVGRNDAAFRAVVSDVGNRRAFTVLDADLFYAQRRFLIVFEMANEVWILGTRQ